MAEQSVLSGTRERGLGRRLKRNKPWTSHHPGSQALRGEGGLPRLGSSVGTEPASQFPQWEEMGEKGPEKEKGHPHEGPRRRAGSPSPPSSSLCKTERKPYPPTPTPVMDYRCFQNLCRMFWFPIGNIFTFTSPHQFSGSGQLPSSWTNHGW